MSDAYPLIWLSRAPYSGSKARAGLDVALSFSVFAQAPEVLLSGDAVLSLVPSADATHPSIRKLLDSFPLYDIEHLWVDAASLELHGIAAAVLPDYAHCADAQAVRRLISGAAHVLSV